jgi:hypothetical protein
VVDSGRKGAVHVLNLAVLNRAGEVPGDLTACLDLESRQVEEGGDGGQVQVVDIDGEVARRALE